MPEKKTAHAFLSVTMAEVSRMHSGKVIIELGTHGRAMVPFELSPDDVPKLLDYDIVSAKRETMSGKMALVKLQLLPRADTHLGGALRMTEERGIEDFVIGMWYDRFEQAIRASVA